MSQASFLHQLIRSLSPSEKKYFKEHVQQHVEGQYKANYEKLFDAMNKWQQEYDEDAFRRYNKNKPFVKNLPQEKKRLEHILLRVMRTYHDEKDEEAQLACIMADIRFLYSKALYNHAEVLVVKGLNLAKDNQKWLKMLEFSGIKWQIRSALQKDFELFDDDREQEELIYRKNSLERQASHLRIKVFQFWIKGTLGKYITEIKQELQRLEHAAEGEGMKTFESQKDIEAIRARVYEFENNYEAALECYQRLIPLWNQTTAAVNEPNPYLKTLLGNSLGCAYRLERFDLFEGILEQLERIPDTSRNDEYRKFFLINEYRLIYLLNTADKSNGDTIVKILEDGIKKYEDILPIRKKLFIYTNICILFLQKKNHELLLDYLNLSFAICDINKDTQHIRDLKFLEIIAHDKLGNHTVVIYLVKNLRRWLNAHQLKDDFCKKMLRFLSKPGAKKASEIKTEFPQHLMNVWEFLQIAY
ncbi:MAG: hypothetical protein U0T73_10205 [Chitinophagales bacterium]